MTEYWAMHQRGGAYLCRQGFQPAYYAPGKNQSAFGGFGQGGQDCGSSQRWRSFVFGRGGEEALLLKENNISFEIVPGITSAIAVPAYAGIPVTHRGVAASFAVVTGHEDPTKRIQILIGLSWQQLRILGVPDGCG